MYSEEKTLRPFNDELNSNKRSPVGMSYLILAIVLGLGFGAAMFFYSIGLNLLWPISGTALLLAISFFVSIGDPQRLELWFRSWSLPLIFDPRKRRARK